MTEHNAPREGDYLPWWRRLFGLYCVCCGSAKCRGCCGCGDADTCTAPLGWWTER